MTIVTTMTKIVLPTHNLSLRPKNYDLPASH